MRSTHPRPRNTIAAIYGVVVLAASGASASALPPDPNNAALVYYRAYLVRPGPDRPWPESLNKFIEGSESLEDVKLDLWIRRDKIELIETAAKMSKCDWGLRYSKGLGLDAPHFLMMQQFAWLLRADVQRLAVEGQYRAALERCMTIRRLGRHVGGETLLARAVTRSIYQRAEIGIRHVLGIMPPSADMLAWLKGQLSEDPGPLPSLDQALRMDLELALQTLRTRADILAAVREALVEQAIDEDAKRRAKGLTSDELIADAREAYTSFLDAALQVIHGSRPYSETYMRLKKLRQELQQKHGGDPAAKQIIDACANQVLNGYNSEVLFSASSNALKAAIEVYLEIARTRRVPFMPPEGVAKDPYSAKDFKYETTKDGFRFRCSAPDLANGTILRPFEFKVRDPNLQREPWEQAADPVASAPEERTSTPAKPSRVPRAKTPTVAAQKEKVHYESPNDLEAIAKDERLPAEVRARAETAQMKLKARRTKDSPLPEPLLIRASVCRVKHGGTALNVTAIDWDHDVIGLRIKEACADPNGRVSALVEDYPAYIERMPLSRFEEEPLLLVRIRDKEQRKDLAAWEAYLIDCYNLLVETRSGVKDRRRIYEPALPPVWISRPEPNRMRVFVCLCDRQGHESEYVEVEDLLNDEPVDPLTYMLMFQRRLEKQSTR
jgi:hypothetical protein